MQSERKNAGNRRVDICAARNAGYAKILMHAPEIRSFKRIHPMEEINAAYAYTAIFRGKSLVCREQNGQEDRLYTHGEHACVRVS